MTTQDKYSKFVIGNYGVRKLVLKCGKGLVVESSDGKKYLDFGAGIAVTSLGHSNSAWVKAVSKQAAEFVHCSNLYMHPNQADLAEELVKNIGSGKIFFCNSGAEANEALIKLSRLHGLKVSGAQNKKFRVLSAINGFHGRTLATLSATAQEKIQKGFAPLLPTFEYGIFNDLSSFEKLMGNDVAAIIVEPVQGESGVTSATKSFLKGLRKLANKYNALLFFDEIQCGIARSGKFLACQHYGVKPDGVSMAKGLGAGFPIGAVWVGEKFADLFTAGSHGSTFGGTPLATAAALATLKEIKAKKLAENSDKMGRYLSEALREVAKKYPQKIKLERGLGLMRAVVLQDKFNNVELVGKCVDNGLLLIPAGSNAIRFLPALNVSKGDIVKAVKIFEKTVKEF